MVETRARRGARAQGHRRRRGCAVLVLVLASLVMGVAPTLAASGGSGLTAPARHSHRPRPHKPHKPRTHSHRPSRSHKRASSRRGRNPFAHRAMWIWELPQSGGGNVSSIIASAHQYGLGTLMIKSSDGTGFWSSQFTPQLVSALHAAGLKVCAWQYVYGNQPITEAQLGARAVNQDHADCLLIDAESEYEGKYVAAQSYITALRRQIGPAVPVALASFPYVDYHPGFPYSVFLGPGGAQDNVPQMYWRDIGVTVDAVFAHTYAYNEIYRRRIFPLGQVYSSPPARQIVRFRQLSRAYGAPGLSWWDWQEASATQWTALSQPAGPLAGYVPQTSMASIGKGAQGDLVVWAQEHLLSAGQSVGVDGNFGASTRNAVENFQLAKGLNVDGVIGPQTWAALLRYAPARIVWGARRTHAVRSLALAGGRPVRFAPVPKSAAKPARRNEIPGSTGAGGHPVH